MSYKQDVFPIVKEAVDDLVNFVKPTFGPKGRKVIIEDGNFKALDDGVSIAERFHTDDEFKNAVIQFVKETARKTNDLVGDGTTGSLIILQALLKNPHEYNLKDFKEQILKQSKEVKTEGELERIAFISSNDSKVSPLVAKAVFSVGKSGVVTVEESRSAETDVEIVKGLEIESGFLSPYMINKGEGKAVWENAYVLVADKKLDSIRDLVPISEKIIKEGGKELVIFADEISTDFLASLVVNKIQGSFLTLAVRVPGYGDRKKDTLKDIAVVTGASVISNEMGVSLRDINLSDLGKAGKIVSDKSRTIIIDGYGDEKDIADRVKDIETEIKDTRHDFDKVRLKERLAKLTGGVAVIRVGAPTESEMRALRYKIEDAVHATHAALKGGYVKGGGVALSNVKTGTPIDEALKEPARHLKESGVVVTDEIVDPTDVVIAQVESAVSIAKILTEVSGILLKRKDA